LHVYRTPRVRGSADAQLPAIILPPALDPAPKRDDARVEPTQGDGYGDGRVAWWERKVGGRDGGGVRRASVEMLMHMFLKNIFTCASGYEFVYMFVHVSARMFP
jgi:hypothetical protein